MGQKLKMDPSQLVP
jgi:hypothetical protein